MWRNGASWGDISIDPAVEDTFLYCQVLETGKKFDNKIQIQAKSNIICQYLNCHSLNPTNRLNNG